MGLSREELETSEVRAVAAVVVVSGVVRALEMGSLILMMVMLSWWVEWRDSRVWRTCWGVWRGLAGVRLEGEERRAIVGGF